jgi:hypothetical protein
MLNKNIYKWIVLLMVNIHLNSIKSQELGYVGGFNKIGIQPSIYQPLYGFSIGSNVSKFFSIETNLFYSQRTINGTTQADYLSFIAIPKIGYFNKKFGVYFAPSLSLNPTLYHSNIKNHTYLSTNQSVGGQINLSKKIIIDLKGGYHFGLTGAYFENGMYKNYKGIEILLGLKCHFNQK